MTTVTMEQSAETVQSLQPWQIFCSMFAIFWLVSAWCDQMLITLVLCIVFGVLSDIITKNMYSEQSELEINEAESKSAINVEAIKANNEKIWSQAEAKLEKEDAEIEVPPPLPTKDYDSGKSIDSLADKLNALAATRDVVEVDGSGESDDDEENNPEPLMREYNRTVSDEYNQNTSSINFNNRETVIEEEEVTGNDGTVEEEDSSDESEVAEKKVYAKDSSDEDDYDYASREVNFDESETEGDTEDSDEGKKDVKDSNDVKDTS